jgi:hypothetical protein
LTTITLEATVVGAMTEQQSPGAPSEDGTIAGRDGKGRFTLGNKASKGRQPGARCKATQMTEQLFADNVEIITKKVLAAGKRGEPWACKLVVSAILPPARSRTVAFPLPAILSAGDIPIALSTVMSLVSEGTLTTQEGAELGTLIDAMRASYEIDKLTAEVETLKAQIAALGLEPRQQWAA